MSMIDVGSRAPDFELAATTQDKIHLAATLRQGPVLLLFYPLDWSPVCTNELCSIRDGFSEYTSLGIQVLGISVDSIFSHKAFAEKLGIAFPLLSDFNKEVCRAYGAFHEEVLGLQGIAKRAAFIVDAEGIVQYRWVSDDPGTMPDLKAIREKIKSL